ncbi:MAG: type VI secretion system tube protein TssD [Chitinophagales bacterium]
MLKATLEIENHKYPLASVNINVYNRGSDYEPNPQDQTMNFQVKSANVDKFLTEWISGKTITKKNGIITLTDVETNKVMQTYSFAQAFCTGYSINFYMQSEDSNQTNITIAGKVSIHSAASEAPGAL